MKFTIQYKDALTQLPKLTEVVMSCDTVDRCTDGIAYLELYRQRFLSGDATDSYIKMGNKVLDAYKDFLKDTREHCEFGMHYPKNATEPNAKFPDLNDYAGALLNVRFAACWAHGRSSVLGEK